MRPNSASNSNKTANVLLWIVQGLLAAAFLFAGGAKLVMPAEMLRGPIPLPVEFLRFIGSCEVLGALGLILPGLLRIRRGLTPLAALGLVIIMVGATAITAASGPALPAVAPAVLGALAAVVARSRMSWVQPRASAQPCVLQPAR